MALPGRDARRRSIPADRPEWGRHLSGVMALHDGTCPKCDQAIFRHGSRVVKHRDEWIHVQCATGWDE